MSIPAPPGELEAQPQRPVPVWVPMAIWLAFTGLLSLLAFALNSSPDSTEEPLVYSYDFTAGAIVMAIIFILFAWLVAYLYSPRDRRATFGFASFTWRDLRLAAVVTVAAVVAGGILEQFLHAGDEQGITAEAWDPARVTPFVINAILIVAVAPFAEELFFRGVGVRVLSVLGAPLAVILSGVMFGLVHGILAALPVLVLFGVGLAYVRYRTGSVFPAMIAHGVFNSIGLAVSFIAT